MKKLGAWFVWGKMDTWQLNGIFSISHWSNSTIWIYMEGCKNNFDTLFPGFQSWTGLEVERGILKTLVRCQGEMYSLRNHWQLYKLYCCLCWCCCNTDKSCWLSCCPYNSWLMCVNVMPWACCAWALPWRVPVIASLRPWNRHHQNSWTSSSAREHQVCYWFCPVA